MSDSDQQRLRDDLFKLSMQQKWGEVVKKYEDSSAHGLKLTKLEDTAFHIAISSYNPKSPNPSHEKSTEKMFSLMNYSKSLSPVLNMQSLRGNTPLHLAAAVGWQAICILIATQDPKLITIRNLNGETPLFIAAHHGHFNTFVSLHDIYNDYKDKQVDPPLLMSAESLCRRKDGNTALHSAIAGEYFSLAYWIMEQCKNLLNYVNVDGQTPLHVLARKPNLFISCSPLGFYESIIYRCVIVDEDDLKKQPEHILKDYPNHYPENYRTCVDIFSLIYKSCIGCFSIPKKRKGTPIDVENPPYVGHGIPINESFLAGCSRSKKQNAAPTDGDGEKRIMVGMYPSVIKHTYGCTKCLCTSVSEEKIRYYGSFPPNYTTCISIFNIPLKVFPILGIDFLKMRKIRESKIRHSHAMKIMNKMIESEPTYKYGDGHCPVELSEICNAPDRPPTIDGEDDIYQITEVTDQQKHDDNRKYQNQSEDKKSESVIEDTPLIVAAKMGILEMVKKILTEFPGAIQDQDSEGRNVLMVAAENRQISVFDFLMQKNLPNYVFHHVDNYGNSILHLAAKLGEKQQPWRIPGAALQMQWEILWYKHVKRSIPSLCFTHHNAKDESPIKIFTQTHEHLVKSGNEWMIKTSESCSVVAALIATVAFATSATVPGGLDQQHGYPVLKDYKAFDIFSVASPIALCLSITALFYFLTIVSWRFEERDFEQDLPRKLLMGLTCLFSGIAAMLVSFVAGHTFVLTERLRTAAVPIYAAAMIPVMFFVMGQLPMYYDLVWAARIKVPLRSYKVFHD